MNWQTSQEALLLCLPQQSITNVAHPKVDLTGKVTVCCAEFCTDDPDNSEVDQIVRQYTDNRSDDNVLLRFAYQDPPCSR